MTVALLFALAFAAMFLISAADRAAVALQRIATSLDELARIERARYANSPEAMLARQDAEETDR